jgi:mRNA interferase MazF
MPTPGFSRGDVVRVPFPYTDRDARQHRPALVVSSGALGDRNSLLWVVMITSAANRRWPGAVSLSDGYAEVGLPVPSVIRTTKIATIESRHADRIGKLDASRWKAVAAALAEYLDFE